MSERLTTFQQAEALRKAGQYADAGPAFRRLWDEQGDASNGWRYAQCLRKSGHPEAALQVITQVVAQHPDDQWVGFEHAWCIYEALVKPASAEGHLGKLLFAGQKMVEAGAQDLALRLTVFAIIKVAKEKGKWDIVSAWCDRLDRQQLSTEPREMGGRRVISEQEQWYFAKVKSLVKLKRWPEAGELALEATQAFPRKRDFARWAARALAGQGDVEGAIAELEALASRGQPEWYLLSDLAELKLRNGQAEAAYPIACRAALAFGEDKAKVGLFLLIGQAALALERFDVAARHAALSRLVRVREGWRVSGEVTRLEAQARSGSKKAGQPLPDLPDDLRPLAALCRQDWEQAVPSESRPRPKERQRRSSAPGASGPFQTGRIKTYKEERGFGFIVPDDGGADLFFHISRVRGIERPEQGMAVRYQVADSPRGPNAVNVQPV